jgi:hypothetical protein
MQICFEFPAEAHQNSRKITFDEFEKNYANFKFNDVLLYVKFRWIELDELKISSKKEKANPGTGRRDMAPFFNWLWVCGVRNIIKVTVEDRHGTSHSDEVIEGALRRFDIEILDWRKEDLDPRTIQTASSQSSLRELHLQWSGNNAILRSWSEPDGLVKITSLRRIHIYEKEVRSDTDNMKFCHCLTWKIEWA